MTSPSYPSEMPPRHWYPDPSGEHRWRYWNGTKWTAKASDRNFRPSPPMTVTYKVVIGTVVILVLGAVTVFGLSGNASPQSAWDACNSDARNVETAIVAYHNTTGTWPPVGPIDKNSVLLKGPTPYLFKAPSSPQYAISTDGAGGMLVTLPNGRTINYDLALNGAVPGVQNPCDPLR